MAQIKISVDPSYAYDMLSIMLIKTYKSTSEQNTKNYLQLEWELTDQLGQELHAKICSSPEYVKLYSTNLALFTFIDEIKQRDAQKEDALKVDSYNFNRFLYKKELQAKFFPDSSLSEQKVGYEGVPK